MTRIFCVASLHVPREMNLVPFSQKLGKFLIFLLLTALTFGLYPLWWIITRIEEQNELLRDIRDGRSRPSQERL